MRRGILVGCGITFLFSVYRTLTGDDLQAQIDLAYAIGLFAVWQGFDR